MIEATCDVSLDDPRVSIPVCGRFPERCVAASFRAKSVGVFAELGS